MTKKRAVGRPKKEATEVIFVRMPKSLAAYLRTKSAAERRELSTTIVMELEKATARARAAQDPHPTR